MWKHKKMRSRRIAGFMMFAGAVIATGNASAEEVVQCPTGPGPGQRFAYMTPGGNGIAPITFCYDEAPQGGGRSAAADPRDTLPIEVVNASRAMVADMQSVLRAFADPKARAMYVDGGFWEYSKKADDCSATYFAPGGFLRITAPHGKLTRPLLTFYSPKIPRPNVYKPIRIGFENSSPASGQEARFPATALNWPGSDNKGGLLSLQVATASQLINGMEDHMRFKLTIGGASVFDVTWRDGEHAKTALRQCL